MTPSAHTNLSPQSLALPEPYKRTPCPTGIDTLLQDAEKIAWLRTQKVALLTNQAAVTATGQPTAYALFETLGPALTCLLTPEHGWSALCGHGQDIQDAIEPLTKLPIYSLYGPCENQSSLQLKECDVLLIDMPDVGLRCYTYAATAAQLLVTIAEKGFECAIWVCDRPNPLGSITRGPKPRLPARSLINYLEVPYQHGLTIGALLQQHLTHCKTPLPLTILSSAEIFDPAHHLWIPPSPGLPDWEAAFLYPGLVMLEGTNVSEGRGTSLPFKCVAAPGLEIPRLIQEFTPRVQGLFVRPLSFTPATDKLAGKACQGVQLHLQNADKVDSVWMGIVLLGILKHFYPAFTWVENKGVYWIDALTGSDYIRQGVDQGRPSREIYEGWQA